MALREFFQGKNKRKEIELILLCLMAIVLVFAVWQVFLKDKQEGQSVASSEESRLVSILETIDGVGETEVMIGVTESGEKSVVVVCEGANNIAVIMDVREAAATALGIEEKLVKVYLKK